VIAQLIRREQRNDQVVAVTDLVVREEGRVVAGGRRGFDVVGEVWEVVR
jgi:hypothetical protein